MMDVESYGELRTAIGLFKLVGLGEDDIRAGRWVEQGRMFDRLEAELETPKKHGRKKA